VAEVKTLWLPGQGIHKPDALAAAGVKALWLLLAGVA